MRLMCEGVKYFLARGELGQGDGELGFYFSVRGELGQGDGELQFRFSGEGRTAFFPFFF